jgi:hypothetical protein
MQDIPTAGELRTLALTQIDVEEGSTPGHQTE